MEIAKKLDEFFALVFTAEDQYPGLDVILGQIKS